VRVALRLRRLHQRRAELLQLRPARQLKRRALQRRHRLAQRAELQLAAHRVHIPLDEAHVEGETLLGVGEAQLPAALGLVAARAVRVEDRVGALHADGLGVAADRRRVLAPLVVLVALRLVPLRRLRHLGGQQRRQQLHSLAEHRCLLDQLLAPLPRRTSRRRRIHARLKHRDAAAQHGHGARNLFER